MSNHVYQQLSITGDLQELIKLAFFTRCPSRTEENKWVPFSEDAFSPMPEDLRGTRSGPNAVINEKEYAALVADQKKTEWYKETGGMPVTYKTAAEYADKYGAANWYDWAIQNWGTKWGTYCLEQEWRFSVAETEGEHIGTLSIRFQSAWSPATLIIQRLSAGFSTLKFKLEYVGENFGFAGSQIIAQNTVIREDSVDCEIENPLFIELVQAVGYTIYRDKD